MNELAIILFEKTNPFYHSVWTLLMAVALYFPIKKLMYQLYLKKFFKENSELKDIDDENGKRLNNRARMTSVLLSFVFSYLYIQNVF